MPPQEESGTSQSRAHPLFSFTDRYMPIGSLVFVPATRLNNLLHTLNSAGPSSTTLGSKPPLLLNNG